MLVEASGIFVNMKKGPETTPGEKSLGTKRGLLRLSPNPKC
jgi:hypothetical protein